MKKLPRVVWLLLWSPLSLLLLNPNVSLAQDECAPPTVRNPFSVPVFPICYIPITEHEYQALTEVYLQVVFDAFVMDPRVRSDRPRLEKLANDFLDEFVLGFETRRLMGPLDVQFSRFIHELNNNIVTECRVTFLASQNADFENCAAHMHSFTQAFARFGFPHAMNTPEIRAKFDAVAGATPSDIEDVREQTLALVLEVLVDLKVTEQLPPAIEAAVRERLAQLQAAATPRKKKNNDRAAAAYVIGFALSAMLLNEYLKTTDLRDKLQVFALPTAKHQVTYGLQANLSENISAQFAVTDNRFQLSATAPYYQLQVVFQFR